MLKSHMLRSASLMAVGLRKKKSYRCMTLSLTVFCSAHALFLWIILCLPESERDGLCFFFISVDVHFLVKWQPSCFMPTDRRIGMTKLIVACRNFAKAPKNAALTDTCRLLTTHTRLLTNCTLQFRCFEAQVQSNINDSV